MRTKLKLWRVAISSRHAARRVLFLAILLLPGTVIVLPLLWWLDRQATRSASLRSGRDTTEVAPRLTGAV